ncbi:MAG: hypothetical protein KDK99_12740, partial [Verrucomicrobiales bacterium]|nr:hypothetical protein [Verrucomicrobiales bacterium]
MSKRLFVLTLLVTAVVAGGRIRAETDVPAPESSDSKPWGKITLMPMFLEASQAMMDAYPLPSPVPRWSVPLAEREKLQAFLTEVGVPEAVTTYVSDPAHQAVQAPWLHLFPQVQDVVDLPSEVRLTLYAKLAEFEPNEYQRDPVLMASDTVQEWYASSSLRPELVDLIAGMSYRRGQAWAFS